MGRRRGVESLGAVPMSEAETTNKVPTAVAKAMQAKVGMEPKQAQAMWETLPKKVRDLLVAEAEA